MSDTELTEKQFNDILQTMWMAGISVEGMVFDVYPSQWDMLVGWVDHKGFSKNTAYYHSDFGTVYFKKVK